MIRNGGLHLFQRFHAALRPFDRLFVRAFEHARGLFSARQALFIFQQTQRRFLRKAQHIQPVVRDFVLLRSQQIIRAEDRLQR